MVKGQPLGLGVIEDARLNPTALGSLDLAVDLDGTLLATDSLLEGAVRCLFNAPADFLGACLSVGRGRAHVKSALANYSIAGMATFPVRQELLAWLEGEAAAGRRLHLTTAADIQVAEAAAGRFGIFESVIASANGQNLKGRAKRDELQKRFPAGFTYIGDSTADLPIFAAAQSIGLAGHSSAVASQASRLEKPVEVQFPRAPSRAKDWLRAMRLHQWSKNSLMLIPLLLDGDFSLRAIETVIAGFLLMGLCASGTYIVNDLSDLVSDRMHSTKCRRPFASGALSLASGAVLATLLISSGLAGAFALNLRFGAVLLLYAATTLAYSLSLKRVALVDVTILACLYALRLVMGAVLAHTPLSNWLVIFALGFFLSLSLAKRQTEIVKSAVAPGGLISGRGYRPEDAGLTLALGVASGMMSLLVMNMFLVFQAFNQPNYRHPHFLWLAPFLIFLWMARVWLLASRGELDDDPVVFAIKDRTSLALGAVLLASVLAAVV